MNISSTRAAMSEPHTEAYAASKGGISALTHALAVSFSQDRITVNSISLDGLKRRMRKVFEKLTISSIFPIESVRQRIL